MTEQNKHTWSVIINAILTALCSIMAGLTTSSCIGNLP